MTEIKSPKKLIEVALPLDAINEASTREKSIRHGHPSTLHLWWARRPLATARAVLFSQMVNDPGWDNKLKRGLKKKEAAQERERLFEIIKKLVVWENTNNQEVLNTARAEIWKSWRETCELNKDHPQAEELFNPEKLPPFHDPFAGGGAIPLEAQRLGLESYASDLNPVAVTINKAMIEIPPKFAGNEPVGPIPEGEKQSNLVDDWPNAKGLTEDVRRYGAWMRAEAEKRVGYLYPKIEITEEITNERSDLKCLIGQKLTAIAWLWARTVKSPNPVFSHVDVPLASSFVLSTKDGKEAYVEPVIDGDSYTFKVRLGQIPVNLNKGTTAGKRAAFLCVLSGTPIDYDYIRTAGKAGNIGTRLMAIVVEGPSGRVYIDPIKEQELVAKSASPKWTPDLQFFENALGFRVGNYGFKCWGDLFTQRQLVALNTFSDLAAEVAIKCEEDFKKSGQLGDAGSYSKSISLYMSFLVDQVANHSSSLCGWNTANTQMRSVFARQTLSMVWDYAESNPFSESSGSYKNLYERMCKGFEALGIGTPGKALQADAATQMVCQNAVVSTDPPYFDNIGYADLSDFFYVWLKRSSSGIFPELFSESSVPKMKELVATPARHGGKLSAETFFLTGMSAAMKNIKAHSHPAFPLTIYYAFKQSETSDSEGTNSSGWETFLEAVIMAGFSVNGTWPMRTEKVGRVRDNDTNALASSIVLVCGRRTVSAPSISRREFIRELNTILPEALLDMTSGSYNSPVAPVDLSQAIIGPGMAIFSKYSAVLEADGTSMPVKTALQLINRFMAEDDFDHDTQFCLHWFESVGWAEGKFGEADVLARAKGTSVEGVKESGVVEASSGKVRLFKFTDYPTDWDPEKDQRTPVWEALHHMLRKFQSEGESGAGALLAKFPSKTEQIRQLSYRLYTLCERKSWAEDARAYNELITAWPQIEQESHKVGHVGTQKELDL